MTRWRAELRRRGCRPLASVALLALAPKCAVCLLAYAGLGAALGLRRAEICGAAVGWQRPWAAAQAAAVLALGTLGLLAAVRRKASRVRR